MAAQEAPSSVYPPIQEDTRPLEQILRQIRPLSNKSVSYSDEKLFVPPIPNEEKIRLAVPNTPIGTYFDQELLGKVHYFLESCASLSLVVKLSQTADLTSALPKEERANGRPLL